MMMMMASNNDTIENVKLFFNTTILPVICMFGVVANLVNTIVYSNRAVFKASLYKYLLIHSCLEIVYLVINLAYFLLKRRHMRSFDCIYYLKAFEFYFVFYFTALVAIILIAIEIVVSLKRLFIIVNYTLPIRMRYIMLAIAAFSLILVSPSISGYQLRPTQLTLESNNVTCYEKTPNAFQRTLPFRLIFLMFLSFRGLIAPLLLILITCLIIVKFKRQLATRRRLHLVKLSINDAASSEEEDLSIVEAEQQHQQQQHRMMRRKKDSLIHVANSLTRMLIKMNFLFILANMFMAFNLLLIYLGWNKTPKAVIYSIFTNFFLYSSHSFAIVIYLTYDHLYSKQFCLLLKHFSPKQNNNNNN